MVSLSSKACVCKTNFNVLSSIEAWFLARLLLPPPWALAWKPVVAAPTANPPCRKVVPFLCFLQLCCCCLVVNLLRTHCNNGEKAVSIFWSLLLVFSSPCRDSRSSLVPFGNVGGTTNIFWYARSHTTSIPSHVNSRRGLSFSYCCIRSLWEYKLLRLWGPIWIGGAALCFTTTLLAALISVSSVEISPFFFSIYFNHY